MILGIYRRVWDVIREKPVKLWGMSLLFVVLSVLTVTLAVIPVITIALALLLEQGMRQVYLRGYRRETIETEQIFSAFGTDCRRKLGGMAWAELIAFLWGLIPLAGIVFSAIRRYENRFVPYILETQPELSASEARKRSREQTEGWKLVMFLADLIPLALCAVLGLLLLLFSMIPLIGPIFGLLCFVLALACAAFFPLILGLNHAVFYEEITSGRLKFEAKSLRAGFSVRRGADSEDAAYCAVCGAELAGGARFCSVCGAKQESEDQM